MLPRVGERGGEADGAGMVQVIERVERDCGVQEPPLGEVGGARDASFSIVAVERASFSTGRVPGALQGSLTSRG